MRMVDLKCSACGHVTVDYLERQTTPSFPHDCPHCEAAGTVDKVFLPGVAATVVPDDIPGGMLIEHGICNEDGTPRRYYSYSAMRKEAAARGMYNKVEHIGERGSDKSKHTTRWV